MVTGLNDQRTVCDLDKNDPRWTVEDLTQNIVRGSEFPGDWLFWPPDVFALTSLIFKQTGCYRCVSSDKWPLDPEWQDHVERAAKEWLEKVDRVLVEGVPNPLPAGPEGFITDKKLSRAFEDFRTLSSQVTVEQLQVLFDWLDEDRGYEDEEHHKAQDLCKALIVMHAVADEACSGFGLPMSPRPEVALAHCLGNLLLTTRGSLSAIPKHHGIVLPKLRTPQSGLTLRSFSHHVTFHSSEVEVMWRATPWTNIEENTVNILCVPWPSEVKEDYFRHEPDTFEVVRYLRYDPPRQDDASYLSELVQLVRRVEGEGRRLHVLMFPESALSDHEYRRLLRELRNARRDKHIIHVPLVLAGVRNHHPEQGYLNEVRLASYFAGRWYDLSQRKHHRWRIDRNQIRQYQLEGRLATARDWYERIPVSQRRLTVLAPNNWLGLCPLICEDLAQLEPVSELIRGIGPTLLMTLLLDGPQLKQRWSARYASVFADDPGTAVLTLTSIGMVMRSRRLDALTADENPCRTVGLWRDQITGWRAVDLGEGQDAILLTISADWTAEYTADGRGDHQNAAVFKFEGSRGHVFPTSLEAKDGLPEKEESESREPTDQDWLTQKRRKIETVIGQLVERYRAKSQEHADLYGRWADIREITAITYALDAALEKKGQEFSRIKAFLLGDPKSSQVDGMPRQLSHLIRLVSAAERRPEHVGVAARQEEEWPTVFFREAVGVMEEWLSGHSNKAEDTAEYWQHLIEEANERLSALERGPEEKNADRRRAKRSIPIAVLAALYNRVEKLRRIRLRQHRNDERVQELSRNSDLTYRKAAHLLEEIEYSLEQYG
jgi:hypothetical protein